MIPEDIIHFLSNKSLIQHVGTFLAGIVLGFYMRGHKQMAETTKYVVLGAIIILWVMKSFLAVSDANIEVTFFENLMMGWIVATFFLPLEKLKGFMSIKNNLTQNSDRK